MVDLKKSGPERRDYVPVSSTLRLQRQNYCALIIQHAWREYLRRQGRPFPPRRAPVIVCGPPTDGAVPAAAYFTEFAQIRCHQAVTSLLLPI